jgi:hypothetical protein
VYGKDLYVAIGDKILTSSDYTTWSTQNLPTESGTIYDVI